MTTVRPAGDIATSDAAAPEAGGAHVPPAAPPAGEQGRRSLLGQALYDTFKQTGARVAAAWIGVVAVIGVFAPFLANTHPVFFRPKGGRLSSPLIASLGPVDVAIVVYFAFGVWVLLRRNMTAVHRSMALLWPVLTVTAVVLAAEYVPRAFALSIYRPQWAQEVAALLGGAAGWTWLVLFASALLLVLASLAVSFVEVRRYTRGERRIKALAAAAFAVLATLVMAQLSVGPLLARRLSAGGLAGLIWVLFVHVVILLLTVLALAALAAFSVNLFRRTARGPVVTAGAVVTALAMAVVSFVVRPPVNVVYERYREMEAAGQVDLIVRTVVPYSPNDRLRDRPEDRLRPPGREHWLGTTDFGEDVLSRMFHACRVTLAIGLIATGIATAVGVVVGGVMGYYGGWVDLIGMRFVEVVEAVPRLILLLIVMVSFGRSLYLMMVVIGLVVWTSDARFIRAEFLKLRNLDFVQAAVATGVGRRSIIFRHMLPNGVSPVLVNASFGVAWAILYESVLSFLGLGLGPDDPSWGQLLEQARRGGTGFNWWIATFPGLAIFLTVFAYILIGEAMRDALDPKLRRLDSH